ncbi:MAG: winged helix-turn-helix domain-containing protein, partial [Turicibacter sanguinis]
AYQYHSTTQVKVEPTITIGDLVVDLNSTRVILEGKEVSLTTTEYEILRLLITHRKKIFSMEQIYQSIWNDSGQVIGDNAVMVHVRNLRKKIEKDSKNPVYIKTAWGKGYYVD